MKKGFVQIPLLVGIIISIVTVFITGASIVFYKQGGITNIVGLHEREEKSVDIEQETEESSQYQEEIIRVIAELERLQTEDKTGLEIEELRGEIERLKQLKDVSSQVPTTISAPASLTNEQIIQKVKPAVVYVQTKTGSGSGFVIDNMGHIITNAHVVRGYKDTTVVLADGNNYPAVILGRDEMVDLAVLKINAINLPHIVLGNSNENSLKQGDVVFAFGFPSPLSAKEVTVTKGVISARQIFKELTFLQTDASIHPGNSGGPLINNKGEVIGINTMVLGAIGAGLQQIGGTGMSFAIPINIAKNYIPDLKAGRNVVMDSSFSPPSTAKTSTVKIERLGDSSEVGVTNEGPNNIIIDHFIFVDWDGRERSTADENFTDPSSTFHYRFPWDLSNTRLKVLKGLKLYPEETVQIYLHGLGRQWKKIRYNPGSIIDAKTEKNIFFESIYF